MSNNQLNGVKRFDKNNKNQITQLLEHLYFCWDEINQLHIVEDVARSNFEKEEIAHARSPSKASAKSCYNARSIFDHAIQERLLKQENRDKVLLQINNSSKISYSLQLKVASTKAKGYPMLYIDLVG